MRKFLFAIFALTAITLVSCAKEDSKQSVESTDNVTTHKMTITTSGGTKTQFSTPPDIIWSTGDMIAVVEGVTGGTDDGKFFQKNSDAGTTGDGGEHMSFPVTLDTHTGATGFQYIAVYPNTSVTTVTSFSNVIVKTPKEQNPTATQFDKSADLLISQVSASSATQPDNLSMAFARKIAICEMNVKNLGSDEAITSVTFTAKKAGEDVVLAGNSAVNLTTSTVSYGSQSQKKEIVLDYSGDDVHLNGSTGTPIYFMCFPFSLAAGDQFKVVIETPTKIFTKEVTLTGARQLILRAGDIAFFDFNMDGIAPVMKTDFSYNSSTWLTSQGIDLPADGAATNLDGEYQTVAPVRVFLKKNGAGTNPRIWNAKGVYDLRLYAPNHLIIGSYNNKTITKILFDANGTLGLTADVGTLDTETKTWTGNKAQVDFTVTATTKINGIRVFYQDAEESAHELYTPITSFNIPYNTTSFTIPIIVANAVGLSASSGDAGFVSATPSVTEGKVDVVLEANATTSPRAIEVTISSTNPDAELYVTINQANAPVTTISAVKALYSDSPVAFTATLTNALVTLVSGNTFFMEDASGGIKGNFSGHGLTVGDKISGAITGTVDKNSGNFTLTALDKSEATVTGGNTVTPTTVAAATLSSNFASYESMLVKVEAVEVSAVSGKNLTLDGIDGFIAYNNSDLSLPVGSQFNAVGPATYYNTTTKEIALYTVEEGDRIAIVPTITATDKSVSVGGTVSISPTINSPGAVTYTSLNTDKATVNSSGVVTGVAAGNATIRISVAATGYWQAGSKDITVTVSAGSSWEYTFTDKTWTATPANWTSGKDAGGFTSGQGIQVTTNASYNGANATSPKSFTGVSRIVVTYNTNKSAGAGAIAIQVGTNAETSHDVAYTSGDGRSANYTETFDYGTKQNGNVKITVNTTTNSLWIKSITIIADSIAD